MGARFTWTLKIDRKIETWRAPGPRGCSGGAGATTTTLPSAGESTRRGSDGTSRSGSRKKKAVNRARARNTAKATPQPNTRQTPDAARGARINGQPSLAMLMDDHQTATE